MIALVPLIVVMYQKVDRAYENARRQREQTEGKRPRPKTVWIDPAKRILEEPLKQKLKHLPVTLKSGGQRGHLVTAILKDGRRFSNVFVSNGQEVLGIYGCETLPFEVKEITDLELDNLEKTPAFTEEGWLRLDGRN